MLQDTFEIKPHVIIEMLNSSFEPPEEPKLGVSRDKGCWCEQNIKQKTVTSNSHV